jgi:hypothetical protein
MALNTDETGADVILAPAASKQTRASLNALLKYASEVPAEAALTMLLKVERQADQLRMQQRAIIRRNNHIKALRIKVQERQRADPFGTSNAECYTTGMQVLVRTSVVEKGIFKGKWQDTPDLYSVEIGGVEYAAPLGIIRPFPKENHNGNQ